MGNTIQSHFLKRHQIPESLLVGEAEITGLSKERPFGYQKAVGITAVPVWDIVGAMNYLSAASTLNLSSSSTADTSAGTGARTVEVKGLDTNYALVTEVVIMDGQSAVAMATDLIRVHSVRVLTVGSGLNNAGDIYVSTGALTAGVPNNANQIYAKMLVGNSKTLMGSFTVPSGHRAYIIGGGFTTQGSSNTVEVTLSIRRFGGAFAVEDRGTTLTDGSTYSLQISPGAIVIPAKADMELQAEASGTTAKVSASICLDIIN